MRTIDAIYLLNRQVKNGSPYKSGNLRNLGITEPYFYGLGTYAFNMGGQQAPYGVILDEAPIINRKLPNGIIKPYSNKHFRWFDRQIEIAINDLAARVGGYVVRS